MRRSTAVWRPVRLTVNGTIGKIGEDAPPPVAQAPAFACGWWRLRCFMVERTVKAETLRRESVI